MSRAASTGGTVLASPRAMRSLLGFALWGVFAWVAGCGGSSTSDGAGGAGAGGGGTGGGAGSGGATGGTAGVGGGGAPGCGPEAKKCAKPSDCVLQTPNCCLCGVPELVDFVAIHQSYADECACKGPVCGCATMTNPNLATTCSAGSCEGFDVRAEADYSGCSSDAECTLRLGLGCCESCQGGEWELVAVKTDQAELSKALCGNEPVACDACAPQYPPSKKAACVSGHCQVVDK